MTFNVGSQKAKVIDRWTMCHDITSLDFQSDADKHK